MEVVNTFCLCTYMSSNSKMDRHQYRNRAEDASICFRKINATSKVVKCHGRSTGSGPIQTVRLCNSCSNSPSASDAETSSMRGMKSGGTFARKTGTLVAQGRTITEQVDADLHTLASSLGGL